MARKLILLLVVFLLFSWASPLHPQEAPCTTRTVIASVFDKQGNPVPGLTARNFRGKFRGKLVEILSATLDTRPRRIVLLLDASGSMGPPGEKWAATKLMSAHFVRLASSQSSVALIVFSNTILQKVGLNQDRVILLKTVAHLKDEGDGSLSPYGKTALYDAIVAGLAELGPTHLGDVIYTITDTGDNRSTAKPSKVERDLVSAGVRLFVLGTFDQLPRGRTPEEAEGPHQLARIVETTGGGSLALVAPYPNRFWRGEKERQSSLQGAFALYQQMQRFYRLEIRLPSEVDKPREWKLEVVDADGKRRNDLNLTFTRRLLPCLEHPPKPN